jgi:hypothetical protein
MHGPLIDPRPPPLLAGAAVDGGTVMAELDDRLAERIAALVRRDRLLAVGSTVAMWVVLVFVFLVSAPSVPGPALVVVLGLAMLALGGLNTASALALVRRYRLAQDQVYRPDIENLDAKRALRARAGGAS